MRACGTSGTKRAGGIGSTDGPVMPERSSTALSEGRSSGEPVSRPMTMNRPPSGPSVVQRFSPETRKPASSGVSAVRIAFG
jgi:hypothetical protein